MSTLMVHPRHIVAMGACLIPGARDWARAHNIDWREFVKNGIPAEVLLATGDGFAKRAVAMAEKESENG